jgi:hypothetical protein
MAQRWGLMSAIPILSPVPNLQDFDGGIPHAVNSDVWQWRKNQFTRAFLAPHTAAMRKGYKLFDPLEDNSDGFERRFGIVLSNA